MSAATEQTPDSGAVQTPALLRRSRLSNRNIGKHLRLHPVTVVWGMFDEEIRPWHGTIRLHGEMRSLQPLRI